MRRRGRESIVGAGDCPAFDGACRIDRAAREAVGGLTVAV
jgi:hypothetical protein